LTVEKRNNLGGGYCLTNLTVIDLSSFAVLLCRFSHVILLSLLSCLISLPVLFNTHKNKCPCPQRSFLLHSFVLHPYLFLCLGCSALCLFVFTYNTQHNHPCGVRIRNPSKRLATSLRPRPRGHWDRTLSTSNSTS
jgi:hypothetical protein